MLKQSVYHNLEQTSSHSLQTEATSQVYEQILNNINQNVYLCKMVPLKWGVGSFKS